ncbi:MAG: N-acetylglucosamine-6-phosphate deacetylase [Verrucomicrobiales bacterium]|nr:N-acetylglucosamine-6-phosphate deacetylase [Verrucomicrobiales bacterium]
MKPFDIQVNGYAGVDFCSNDLTAEQFHHACAELKSDGVGQILATVITDTLENLEAKLSKMARFREDDSLVEEIVAGFHIEGPFMSAKPGYAGAHPPEAMRPGNVDDAKRLLDACNGLARLVTVAPECDPGFKTIAFLAENRVTVSAGHCDPDLDQLKGAIDHGLSMVTHFGNGCPVDLPRHDNVLQRFLHFREYLWFCFIPDGAHVELFALKNYLDFVGMEKSIMVTDAIGAAKMPPGIYKLSGISIEVDSAGVARRPGSPNLAGSTITMPGVIENLRNHLRLTEEGISQVIGKNPRSALGQ